MDPPFQFLDPAALPRALLDPALLILDIRPHAAYSSARIPHAISLSVPSTLLKRPLFSLQRLSAMLSSASARARFSAWPAASRIIVYDVDSITAPDASNIAGLLRKFKSDGFKGDLVWLRGGFQAVWRDRRDVVDTHPPTPDLDLDDDDQDKATVLRASHLPMAAFSLSSTTVHNSPHFNSSAAAPSSKHPRPVLNAPPTNSHPAFNPFFDTIRQNSELSHGITERIPLRLPYRVRRRIHELPFPWLQDIARRAADAPHLRDSLSGSSSSESEDDDRANPTDIEEGMEALAMQFFKIELSEQRRLMGVMEHHSKESGQEVQFPLQPFPYSITAGVEKGTKNRYRHIWPFEHARVKLHQKKEVDDDYINASYIHPLGTNKRYIATQGPLPTTFTDFWTLCWEQNVHVIVMLTREVEGAMDKCGAYWEDTVFGPLRLRLVSTEGLAVPDERPSTAGFFAPPSPNLTRPPAKRFPHSAGSQRRHPPHHYHSNRSETVKRVFELTHTGYPQAKPRKITQFQYLGWPDMNVPEDPRGVLGLIREVEEAVKETQVDDPLEQKWGPRQISIDGIEKRDGPTPVLMHCSAGVGRTGGFIAIDAILDAIRREVRNKNITEHAMEVDLQGGIGVPDPSAVTTPLTMSSGGGESLDSNQHNAALVANVLVATPMEVDSQTHTSRVQSDAPSTTNSGTMQWAENVRDETGISGANTRGRNIPNDSYPPASLSVPGSSIDMSSTETAQLHGNYYYNSSSSIGTSVSGTSSSSSKAGSSSSKLTRESSLANDLLQAVLNNQQNAVEHRLRTISAPSMIRRTPPQSLRLSEPQSAFNPSGPRPKKKRTHTNIMSPSKLPTSLNSAGMSSDSESPSRSQSPSADEAISYSQPTDSHTYQNPAPQHPTQSTSQGPTPEEPPAKTFDYKEPRDLNEKLTPPLLTTLDDPIWEVLQDMREQRMSLCQSLRQYVFVHAAIIEGALMVIDDEKEFIEGFRPRIPSVPRPADPSSPPTTPFPILPMSSPTSRQPYSPEASSVHRGASLTDLLKEYKVGDAIRIKRPSIKRKLRSGDDLSLVDGARYHTSPPGTLHGPAPSSRAMPP